MTTSTSPHPQISTLLGRILASTTFRRVLVILGIILCSIFVGLKPNLLFLAIPVIPVGVVLLIKRPQLGFILLIVASLAVPFGIGTGTVTTIHAGMIVLVGLLSLWFLEGVMHRTLGINDHPTTLPLILFLLIVFIAFLTGQLTWFPKVDPAPMRSQLGGMSIFFLSAAAFWLIAFRTQRVQWLQTMMWAFFAVSVLWLLDQLPNPLRDRLGFLFERGSSGATGSLFWVWLMSLSFGQVLLNRRLHPIARLALLVLVGVSLYLCVIVNREWTSGWLPSLLAMGLIVWLGFPRFRYLLLILAVGLAFVRVLPSITGYVLTKDNDYSFLTRVAAAATIWQLVQYNPLLGFGPANYYFYTPLFNILGYNNIRFNSHNNYVDLVAQTGFLGFFVFLWFAWRVGRYALAVQDRMPEGFPRAYVISALAGWVGTLFSGILGDWFFPFVYNIGFAGFRSSVLAWIFLGGVLALDRLIPKEISAMPNELSTNLKGDKVVSTSHNLSATK